MCCIIKDEGKRVFENGHSLIETNAVFPNIVLGFGGIPLESHGHILLDFIAARIAWIHR
jgi:hypothetical protein